MTPGHLSDAVSGPVRLSETGQPDGQRGVYRPPCPVRSVRTRPTTSRRG